MKRIDVVMMVMMGAPLTVAAQPAVRLDVTEVTAARYAECVAARGCTKDGVDRSEFGPSEFCNFGKAGKETQPMNCVDWSQAVAFCRWAGKRLPTEQEWDAAAFGSDRKYPWGNQAIDKQCCWERFDTMGTCRVGKKPACATPDGLMDMAGNVWEWTSSRYCPGCNTFSTRGGCFSTKYRLIHIAAAGFRGSDEPSRRGSYLGFRCATGGGPPPNPGRLAPAPVAPELPVDMKVITTEDDKGNAMWTEEYARKVLERAGSIMHSEVRFRLASFERLKDRPLYETKKQEAILDGPATKAAKTARVTVFVSQPHTSDNAGTARQNSGVKGFKPCLVIRSRKNTGTPGDQYECAAIFLHELGHTIGFTHSGKFTAKPYPTDGYWDFQPGREVLVQLTKWIELHEHFDKSPAILDDRFKCKVGGHIPSSNQLFDPATGAPTREECAARCWQIPDCIGFAQPTWANAECTMFGKGAKASAKKGYNNVAMCWRK